MDLLVTAGSSIKYIVMSLAVQNAGQFGARSSEKSLIYDKILSGCSSREVYSDDSSEFYCDDLVVLAVIKRDLLKFRSTTT